MLRRAMPCRKNYNIIAICVVRFGDRTSYYIHFHFCFSGIIPCFMVPFLGIIPCFVVPFSGIIPCFGVLFSGIIPCFMVLFLGIIPCFAPPSAQLPYST